jgi:hypothetical protein
LGHARRPAAVERGVAEWPPRVGRWTREYPRWPSTAVVSTLFGSWNAAMAAAGLPVTPYAYTNEEVIEALRVDARRLRRAPRIEDWRVRDPSGGDRCGDQHILDPGTPDCAPPGSR